MTGPLISLRVRARRLLLPSSDQSHARRSSAAEVSHVINPPPFGASEEAGRHQKRLCAALVYKYPTRRQAPSSRQPHIYSEVVSILLF